jgi:hypothetical protein
MKFEVYCDESHPDALSSTKQHAPYLLIGSLWLPAEQREKLKEDVKKLRAEHQLFTEIKWHKVHRAKAGFYEGLVDLFFEYGSLLRFRCIVIEADKVDLMRFHKGSQELGFYKFYYQLLHQWIKPQNEYSIFCDEKSNAQKDRVKTLKRCLTYGNLSADILNVQSLPSDEVVLIQFTDFLLGMASSRLNKTVAQGSYKDELICHLEQRLGVSVLCHTPKDKEKYNIFKINLSGGW